MIHFKNSLLSEISFISFAQSLCNDEVNYLNIFSTYSQTALLAFFLTT